MSTQLTSVVLLVGGKVGPVRAHAGYKPREDCEEYVDALEGLPNGACVEFHPIELWEDIGDPPAESEAKVYRFRLEAPVGFEPKWVEY
jgi:hypothetical protein